MADRRRWAIFLALALIVPLITAQLPSSVQTTKAEPVAEWSVLAAQELLAFIETLESHGLDPRDYQSTALESAIRAGKPADISEISSTSFAAIAHDFAKGRLAEDPVARRFGGMNAVDPSGLMELAHQRGQVRAALDSMAPQDLDYLALRNALGALAPDAPPERRAALVATLERRRWMPREAQGRHIVVNVPAFRLELFDGDRLLETHRVIVGKPATETPQFAATVEAVTVNPSWYVPASIVAESVGGLIRRNPAAARAKGYRWSRSGSGSLSVVQIPGPGNALGQIKFELPNDFRVYIHDTPDRSLFEKQDRALSHGCIRLAEPTKLAATLLESEGWSISRIEDSIAAGQTSRIELARPIPVQVVYFTAERAPDGAIRYWPDIYDLDRSMAQRLTGDRSRPLAARQTVPECAGLA